MCHEWTGRGPRPLADEVAVDDDIFERGALEQPAGWVQPHGLEEHGANGVDRTVARLVISPCCGDSVANARGHGAIRRDVREGPGEDVGSRLMTGHEQRHDVVADFDVR